MKCYRVTIYINPIPSILLSSALIITISPTFIMLRRVRFASTNVLYAPSSRVPSPALSESSLSSLSPDLLTPPPNKTELEPSIFSPSKFPGLLELDPIEDDLKDIDIHYLLAFTPYTNPALPYDFSLPPQLSSEVEGLSQPATHPPLQRLTIVHPLFMWNVEVVPSSSSSGAYVTVNDVLSKLHRELNKGVDPAHYAELPPTERRCVDNAYFSRCSDIQDVNQRDRARARGVIKLDFLAGQTHFMGLSGTTNGPDIWELNVSHSSTLPDF